MDSNGNKYRRKAVSITILIITSLTGIRIHLQDVMRHLSRNPCDEDVKQIEHLQDSLRAQFAMLDQSQLEMSGSSRLTVIPHDDDTFSQFDDLNDDHNEVAENSSPALAHDDWLLAVGGAGGVTHTMHAINI
jgi:hypothetical protein